MNKKESMKIWGTFILRVIEFIGIIGFIALILSKLR